MDRSSLRVITGRTVAEELAVAADPVAFQAGCIEAYLASWTARGFSPVTIENDGGVLERMLGLLGRPAWEVTVEDVDRVVGALASNGLAASTRRGYVQAFKGFHEFLQARKALEIEGLFGARLVSPLDQFNAARHVADDSPAVAPPPTVERVTAFFDFLRDRVGTARKYAPAARDYAMFRTLYHAGLRADEAAHLERADVHFTRGPFGKLHVRFGKAAHTSGPRPRWVPVLDGLDLVLTWYLRDVRGRFPDSVVLFADESGGPLHRGTIRNRLRHLMELEGGPPQEWFSPHALRRACATHNYERGGGSGGDPADAGALDGGLDDAVRAPVGHVHRGCLPARGQRDRDRARGRGPGMRIGWKLRMAAAQREVWTGAQLRRLLAERAGLQLSSASVSALLTKEPNQIKLSTLIALCTALECTPNDLLEVDTTPVEAPAAAPSGRELPPETVAGHARSMPPL